MSCCTSRTSLSQVSQGPGHWAMSVQLDLGNLGAVLLIPYLSEDVLDSGLHQTAQDRTTALFQVCLDGPFRHTYVDLMCLSSQIYTKAAVKCSLFNACYMTILASSHCLCCSFSLLHATYCTSCHDSCLPASPGYHSAASQASLKFVLVRVFQPRSLGTEPHASRQDPRTYS